MAPSADCVRHVAGEPCDGIEKPAMLAKVPDLRGKRVLALGCGTGEECTALLERGALHIVGVDRSEAMLALARQAFAADPRVHFACMDMCRLGLARHSFDYVYSSLALHYACNWREVPFSYHYHDARCPSAAVDAPSDGVGR